MLSPTHALCSPSVRARARVCATTRTFTPAYPPLALQAHLAKHFEQAEVAVCDIDNHCVQVFDHEGSFMRQFGTEGEKDCCFNSPCGVTSDRDGNIFVLDRRALQAFTSDARHLWTRDDGVFLAGFSCVAWGKAGELAVGTGGGTGLAGVFAWRQGPQAPPRRGSRACASREPRACASRERARSFWRLFFSAPDGLPGFFDVLA